MNLARLEKLPDWPARMTAEIAAAYMGIGKSTFLDRYRDCGVQEGANVLWARLQLDRIIAKQFSMPQPAGRAANEDSSWDDLP
jgi:hypothetical protein